MGDFAGAAADFGMEIKLTPGSARGYLNRAAAYGEQEKYDSAMADLHKVMQIDPLISQAYLYKGIYELKMNLRDSACVDFKVAEGLKNPGAEPYIKQYCK
jgi:tetratricopeptide (TPR) repeat protein